MTQRDKLDRAVQWGGEGALEQVSNGALSPLVWNPEERPPLWQQGELWSMVSAAGKLFPIVESEAVKLIAPEKVRGKNYYGLRLGTQRLLHYARSEILDWAEGELEEIGKKDGWKRNRLWLSEELFPRFFLHNQDTVAWVNLITKQRPTAERSLEDPQIRIEAKGIQLPAYDEIGKGGWFPVGSLRLPTRGLCLACPPGAAGRRKQMATVVSPYSVSCGRFGILAQTYSHIRVCLARAGEDEYWLRQGAAPALPEDYDHDGPTIVGKVPLLSLVKTSHKLDYTVLAVAIHPDNGAILDLRWYHILSQKVSRRGSMSGLAVGLLCASPVEHAAMSKVVLGSGR